MLTSRNTNIYLTLSKTNKYCKSIVYYIIIATVLSNVNIQNFIIARKAFTITTKSYLLTATQFNAFQKKWNS